MNATTILWVGVGGALGSVARYVGMSLIATALGGLSFPWATLAVNVLGSFIMGILAGLGALIWQPSADLRAFLAVGILGGFTTFSTFSLDVAGLVERDGWGQAFLYVTLSLVLGIGALFLAMGLIRQMATGS